MPENDRARELLQRLEEGVRGVMSSEGWREFLQAQAKFHHYSAGNVLLILSQDPHATRVAGFHTWREMGRFVKKGEHGIAILAPVFPKKEEKPEAGERTTVQEPASDGKVAVDSGRVPVRFRVAHVFDVAQTEGEPLPQPPIHELRGESEQAWHLIDRLTKFASSEGLRVSYAPAERMPRGARGYYEPGARAIVLQDGLSRNQRAKTLAHELAHHMLQHGRGREPGRPTEEAEAEGTAFVVCNHFGLDTSDYSFGYVATWSRDEGGVAIVKQASAAIQGTARDMIDGIERQAQQQRVQARGMRIETMSMERAE